MTEPIEEAYFNWLCAKLISPHANTYRDLFRILHKTEFAWVVPGDRNRQEDGVELRLYFLNETGYEKDELWYNELCSVLEVFISFASRASFQTEAPVANWFWIFIENLNLNEYRRVSQKDIPVIEEILYTFVWRTYPENGLGGLFPLYAPRQDQREVEIWYQFCAWVDEKELI